MVTWSTCTSSSCLLANVIELERQVLVLWGLEVFLWWRCTVISNQWNLSQILEAPCPRLFPHLSSTELIKKFEVASIPRPSLRRRGKRIQVFSRRISEGGEVCFYESCHWTVWYSRSVGFQLGSNSDQYRTWVIMDKWNSKGQSESRLLE